MRKICRTILAAGLMACIMMPAVNAMATDNIVGNWQADEAGVGFAKISASLVGLDGLCININEDDTADIIFAVDGDETKTVNEERELKGQQKVDRGPNAQVLTTHVGINPSYKSGYER